MSASCVIVYLLRLYLFLSARERVKIKENDPDSDVALLVCQRHIISSPEFFASFFLVAQDLSSIFDSLSARKRTVLQDEIAK